MNDNLPIRDYRGNQAGMVTVEAEPYDANGVLLEDEIVDDTSEILGKHYKFSIAIKKMMGLSTRYSQVYLFLV